MANKIYKYFISYFYKDYGRIMSDVGYGSLILKSKNIINWETELIDTQKLLEEKTGCKGLIIINFIEL